MADLPLPKFKLSLLGRFELAGPEGPVDLLNKKLAGLLAYLACTAPRPQPREKLATLLWGSHFEAQARQNLRQALFRVRRVLGPHAFVGDGETITLSTNLVACDVARFEALVGEGSRDSLRQAIALYEGLLLADMAIPEEAWIEWVESERQRLETLALDAMTRLAEQELAGGNLDSSLRTAHRVTEINNLREDAHRVIMRAMAASGRKGDALKHYERVADLMKSELNVEPDAATVSLATELRKPLEAQLWQPGPAAADPIPIAVPKADPALHDRPSIAVLPFKNMSGDSDHEYFADGIAEDILTALSKWRWFLVFARNSTFTFKNQRFSPRQVGEALGARYVLDGSVRRAGGRVRVSARLIEAATERQLWADRYDRELTDVFAVEDEITRQVVTAVDPAIQISELERILRKPPTSMDAWDHFLRGCYHNQSVRTRDAALALEHLNCAIEIEPHFAAAHARLALVQVFLAAHGQTADPGETLAKALEAADTAIELDGFDASAHAAACYALVYRRQYEPALQAGRRAVELNTNFYLGHYAFAHALLFAGSPGEAVQEFKTTIQLSPRDPGLWAMHGNQAFAHYTAKEYEAARESADRALAERAVFAGAHVVKVAALVRLGRMAEAESLMAEIPKSAFFQLPYYCPFRDKADWEHLRGALEIAGWERSPPLPTTKHGT